MSTNKDDLRDYADGWISERKGTEVPPFLKASYVVVGLGTLVYLLVLKRGEVAHATRGALVRQFNMSSSSADGVIFLTAGLAVIYLIGLCLFAFKKSNDH